MTGEQDEAAALLHWLRVVANNLVRDQWHRITRLALALQERTVLSGEDAVAIIEGRPTMPTLRKPKTAPEPALPRTSDGVPIIVQRNIPPTTVLDPHALVAKARF